MADMAPELKGFSEREMQLQVEVERCARLMVKADSHKLGMDELQNLLFTETNIRKKAKELGLTSRQLELMLERKIQRLRVVSSRAATDRYRRVTGSAVTDPKGYRRGR